MVYQGIEATSISELNTKVNRLINQGWEPIGGISLTDHHGCSYAQALIKGNKLRQERVDYIKKHSIK